MTRGREVYPRVCGGTIASTWPIRCLTGLSPRVRGNRLHATGVVLKSGSIPACAGEPSSWYVAPSAVSVYPRVCGGTASAAMARFSARGLSPRARGNLLATPVSGISTRSIPACAGEPGLVAVAQVIGEVYPRVCGGTRASIAYRSNPDGLSPRVRGNRHPCIVEGYRVRSIPACAGEPHRSGASMGTDRVYPRVCGGTGDRRGIAEAAWGLSPRVRGNLASMGSRANRTRSIPACAGEPSKMSANSFCLEVYPRVCGGTGRPVAITSADPGLSPRVRGNRFRVVDRSGNKGSIPACAGEPVAMARPKLAEKVYPRVCGGTAFA